MQDHVMGNDLARRTQDLGPRDDLKGDVIKQGQAVTDRSEKTLIRWGKGCYDLPPCVGKNFPQRFHDHL